MADYPGEVSLKQIYGTYNRALLKVVPTLQAYAELLTDSMVAFSLVSQKHFTTDIQAHYVYSPCELTRWVRGIYEAIRPFEMLSVEGLVHVWAHEALPLFQDRLVTEDEKTWTDEHIDNAAMEHFPPINRDEALHRPILFSNRTCHLFSSMMFSTTSFELIKYSARRRNIYFLLESAEVARQVPLSLEQFCFDFCADHCFTLCRMAQ
jgi:dynein heavy chain 1